jgi:hypothetical protein
LVLYYITKGRKTDAERTMKGEGRTFYSPEEVIIAFNEKRQVICTRMDQAALDATSMARTR